MPSRKVKKNPAILTEIVQFTKNFRLATLGGLIVLLFIIVALFAPVLAPRDPNKMNLKDSMEPPGALYLLGTDYSGRDMLSRIMYGARVSLVISLASVMIGATAGVTLGVMAAWFKHLQNPIMRLMDIMLSFPSIIVALTIISILGTGVKQSNHCDWHLQHPRICQAGLWSDSHREELYLY